MHDRQMAIGKELAEAAAMQSGTKRLYQLLKPLVRGYITRKRLRCLVTLTKESQLTSGLRKPGQIRNELYDSEKDYVKSIETLLLAYLVPISEHPLSYNFQNRCRSDLLEANWRFRADFVPISCRFCADYDLSLTLSLALIGLCADVELYEAC